MDEQVEYTLDLARTHVQVGDLELATQNLLACLFAVSIMTGKPPRSATEKLTALIPPDESWFHEIMPAIMGEADSDLI